MPTGYTAGAGRDWKPSPNEGNHLWYWGRADDGLTISLSIKNNGYWMLACFVAGEGSVQVARHMSTSEKFDALIKFAEVTGEFVRSSAEVDRMFYCSDKAGLDFDVLLKGRREGA